MCVYFDLCGVWRKWEELSFSVSEFPPPVIFFLPYLLSFCFLNTVSYTDIFYFLRNRTWAGNPDTSAHNLDYCKMNTATTS